jgi:oxepin-CoA hydrolase/3-oxo-5,6-dehydrosuberyl-CoA semialdehyde dehydrogenase
MQLENYALGRWVKGEGEGLALYNSINGELVATATSKVWILAR